MTDYDQTNIPASYDRAREHGPEVRDLWMRATAKHLTNGAITRILDLGCGTGRFTEGLAAHFNCEVLGLDPSVKMLEQARAKLRDTRVQYQQGHAESIPLPAQSVNLVFMSMSYHHFTNPVGAAHECRRVLRDGGSVVVRTGSRDQIPSYPYVPFFPTSLPHLETRLPSCAEIRETFIAAGFHEVASEVITQTIAPNWSVYAEKLAAGGDSVLAQLRQQDFADGLARVRQHAATDGEHPVIEPIDLLVFQFAD